MPEYRILLFQPGQPRYSALTMLCDVLIPALEKNFPNRGLCRGKSPDPIAVFPAAHPDVGDVIIYDDGDEATIQIGDISHGHFGWDDPDRTGAAAAHAVTEQIVHFLNDLFADRILLWKQAGDGAGGWYLLSYNDEPSFMGVDDLTFVWSGPVTNPLRESAG